MSDELPPPTPVEPPPASSPTPRREDLTDGQWHRLHPATPFLRGGIALLAALAIVVANLREQLVYLLFPRPSSCEEGDEFCVEDPLGELYASGNVVYVLLIALAILVILIVGFWLSWRMHAFRITDDTLEVKSGILFRTHRQGRLDRIQGINIARPFLARLLGVAKLEVTVAGQDANIQLAYLTSSTADDLRLTVLRLASGARRPVEPAGAAAAPGEPGSSLIDRRISELTGPELDPSLAPPESIVHMPVGRLVASTALSGVLFWLLIPVIVVLWLIFGAPFDVDGSSIPIVVGSLIPAMIGAVSYAGNRIVKSLRFTIAGTPDGIRVGYGLLSTSNETLPPGRIHSLSITQPLLWRPFDWWEVKVNRAGTSSAEAAAGRQNTTLLPVGSRDDAFRVVQLVLPGLTEGSLHRLVENGLAPGASDDGYTTSPRRAAVLRWFSWRRNGFAVRELAVVLRRGAIWRELVIVPAARIQSVTVRQGPLLRALRLAETRIHTVAGPVATHMGAIDRIDAEHLFHEAARVAVGAGQAEAPGGSSHAPGGAS